MSGRGAAFWVSISLDSLLTVLVSGRRTRQHEFSVGFISQLRYWRQKEAETKDNLKKERKKCFIFHLVGPGFQLLP